MSIRTKLILSTTIPLLLIYVFVLSWDYYQSGQLVVEQTEQLVAERAGGAAAQVNGQLATVQQIVDSTAANVLNRPAGSESQRLLPGMLRASESIYAAWVIFDPALLRPRGSEIVLLSRGGGGGGGNGNAALLELRTQLLRSNPIEQPWYKKIQTSGTGAWFDADEYAGPNSSESCLYAAPFFTSEGATFAGVVCAQIRYSDLQNLGGEARILRTLQLLRGGNPASRPASRPTARPLSEGGYLLFNRQGKLISQPAGETVRTDTDLTQDPGHPMARAINRALKGDGEIVVADNLDQLTTGFTPGERYVLALEPVPTTGWVYVTAVPQSGLMGQTQARLAKRGISLLVSLFVLIGMLMFVITRFCRPIEQMASTVDQLSRGQLDIEPVPVLARDELGQLARGFNAMTTQLRDHVAELTLQTAEREKVQSELRIARQIQRDLLPRKFPPFPDRNEFALHAVNIPARHIAGDFFDFFFTDPDLLMIAIADVSGKGVPAALMMAVTRTMVRNMAVAGLPPREIVQQANRLLVEDTNPGLFVTMILGQYRVSTGELTYVNAGHPPAVRYRPGLPAETACTETGPLVGVDVIGELGPFEECTITLAPGEGLLLYTDGVTEAHNTDNVFYRESRLLTKVTELNALSPRDLCEKLVKDVLAFQHQAMTDDLTLVSLQRR